MCADYHLCPPLSRSHAFGGDGWQPIPLVGVKKYIVPLDLPGRVSYERVRKR